MMSLCRKVTKILTAIEGYDAYVPGSLDLRSLDPVDVQQVAGCRTVDHFVKLSMLCSLAGCAVVWDGQARLIGRRTALALAKEAAGVVYRRQRRSVMQQIDSAMMQYHLDAIPERTKRRQALVTVQHKIAEHYPGLRIWQHSDAVEVWLAYRHGGQYLGGAVWRWEYYTSGEYLKHLP